MTENNNKKYSKIYSKNRSRRNRIERNKKPGCGVCGNIDGKYKCPKCRLPYCSVKCCRQHKETCSLTNKTVEENGGHEGRPELIKLKTQKETAISRYLPSDALIQDPLTCAIKRRKTLDDEDEEEKGWKITREMMDRLDNSSWLKEELADGGLRQIIAQIDSAEDNFIDTCEKDGISYKKQHIKKQNLKNKRQMSQREIELARAKHRYNNFARFIDKLLLTAGVIQHVNDWDTGELLNKLVSGDATIDDVGALQLVPLRKTKSEDLTGCSTHNLSSSNSDSDDSDASDSSSFDE